MVGIGEFARLGEVSVRMLRHYDALGLLRPHAVDPVTGTRSYTPAQLPRLNRITALAGLGFPLRQVRAILDDEVATAEVAVVLAARRDELQARITADTERLGSVQARLRAVEAGAAGTHDPEPLPFTLRRVEPVRLAGLSAVTNAPAAPGMPPVPELLARVTQQLAEAGATAAGPPIVQHRPLGDGRFQLCAGLVVAEDADLPYGVDDVLLPALPTAVCIVVAGSVEDADADLRTLAWWLHDNGYRYDLDQPTREVHLRPDPAHSDGVVVELQMAVVPAPRNAGQDRRRTSSR